MCVSSCLAHPVTSTPLHSTLAHTHVCVRIQATLAYVSAMQPLEKALLEWHLHHEREVEGLHAKIQALETLVREQDKNGRDGAEAGGMEGGLKKLKQTFLDGLEEGESGLLSMAALLREKELEIEKVYWTRAWALG